SYFLAGFIASFLATSVSKLLAAVLPILAKAEVYEFGMGPDFGAHQAVADRQAPFAVVSDTAGTARHIAAQTGVVAVNPTYGAISRYGVVAAVSSMDTVTP